MGRIHILSPAVADRIAAGEVVERPGAVLRELLDNSRDAGARRIEVDLAAGGVDLVEVADDGHGLGPDDAVLAFERHATSKIRTGEDLAAVATLGFRGEALAAIAAVSRVEMLTRSADSDGGTRVVIDRGKLVNVIPAARAPGTTVTVRDLFAGVPARRKFLKGPGAELEHCLLAATRAALGEWEIGLRVRSEGRDRLVAPPASDPRDRIVQVLGPKWGAALVPATERRGGLVVSVWAGPADLHRTSRDGIHLFVNRRAVRDPLLLRTVLDAYRRTLPGGCFPVVVVQVEISPAEVDVNVHPAKSEVRFQHPRDVRGAVLAALESALGSRAAIPHLASAAARDGAARSDLDELWSPAERAQAGRFPFAGGVGVREGGAPDRGAPGVDTAPGRVRALAQHRNCYIVAEDEEGLLVVDQHVAHERLLYENLLRQADAGPLPRQSLLFPATIEAGPEAVELAAQRGDMLARAGFQVESFGDGALIVREVPAVLGREVAPDAVVNLLQSLAAISEPGPELLFHRLLATVACHAAVKKGMALTLEKMDYILQGLGSCAAPTHCPHGRVISLRVDLAALDRGFGRA